MLLKVNLPFARGKTSLFDDSSSLKGEIENELTNLNRPFKYK